MIDRPELLRRLGGPARVTVVSAPAGSGKTMLLRSWAGQAGRIAWVPAGRDRQDSQGFWLAVSDALYAASAGLVRTASAAPRAEGWSLAERLLTDLAGLEDDLWLAIDDVHELGAEVLQQLELLIMRAPPGLRFVLAARNELRLGLHRLRLEGELTEIRAADLRFTLPEAGALLAEAGVTLSGPATVALHERTEGWAAGLRLAALSLAGNPDPERLAREFSGTDRTAAEYLLAEVLDRQPEKVRRMLLRTSVLERVTGELADLLTGDEGAERELQDLEDANAFVVSLDAERTWFRYHQMFAGLLRMELRRADPAGVAKTHQAAGDWLAAHGYETEAIRQYQAAGDWNAAVRLLVGGWPAMHLDGRASEVHALLAGFPPGLAAVDPGLAVVTAADQLAHGSRADAERYHALARQQAGNVPAGQDGRLRLLLGLTGLLLAHREGNLPTVTERARQLEAIAEPATGQHLQEDLRALALITLGITQMWADAPDDAGRHLEAGLALARRIGRPYLEFTSLGTLAAREFVRSVPVSAGHARKAMELAERHGWTGEPAASTASVALGAQLAWEVRPREAEPWIQRAERTLSTDTDPAVSLGICYIRGVLELAYGRDSSAITAFQAAEKLAGHLASPHFLLPVARGLQVHALVRRREYEQAARYLAGLGDEDRDRAEIRVATAALDLAQGDPQSAAACIAPVLNGAAAIHWHVWLAPAWLMEAAARDALGDPAAAETALERALDLAEPDGVLLPFLLHPAPGLLKRHAGHKTAHGALLAEIRGLIREASATGAPRPGNRPERLLQSLSGSELRVLRYLPTNLTGPEIARELSLSPNTVKTHIRSLYAKLGVHNRKNAVRAARDLGLLAPPRSTGDSR